MESEDKLDKKENFHIFYDHLEVKKEKFSKPVDEEYSIFIREYPKVLKEYLRGVNQDSLKPKPAIQLSEAIEDYLDSITLSNNRLCRLS